MQSLGIAGLLGLVLLLPQGRALAANSDEVNKLGGPAGSMEAPLNGSSASQPPPTPTEAARRNGPPELAPVAVFDIDRFAGAWQVIASLPDRFHRRCVAGAEVRYALQPRRRLQLEQRCRAEDGSLQLEQGEVRLEPPGSPEGRLEVRYTPSWLGWLPLAWSEVWVVALGKDYRHAALATPDRDFLWILSRTPALEPQVHEALVQELAGKGFDVAKLKRIPPDPETTAPAGSAPGQ